MIKLTEQELNRLFEDVHIVANLGSFINRLRESTLREETATRFIQDAMAADVLKMNNEEQWNWLVARVDDELRQNNVYNNGYLEGLTWKEFFKDFNVNVKNLIPGNKLAAYDQFFGIYKQILWLLDGILDEKTKTLKWYVKNYGVENDYEKGPRNVATKKLQNTDINAATAGWRQQKGLPV